MSTAAIDTSRTSERLSGFLSEIGANEPVDQTFVEMALSDYLMKGRKVGKYGRQTMVPLDTAQNGSVQAFADTDSFDTAIPNTARMAVFPMKNYGGTLVWSWEEMQEMGDDDHRVFDLVQHRRKNVLGSLKDLINSDMFAVSIAAKAINSLPVICSVDRSLGGIDSTSSAYWDAQETTAVGAFASSGISSMRTLYNNIKMTKAGEPDIIITTQAIMEAFENEIDVDVRYAQSSTLSRGAEVLKFRKAEIMADDDVPSGHLYMLNSKNLQMRVEAGADFKFGDVKEHFSQFVYAAKLVLRAQLIPMAPRGLGRLTGIT